MQVSEILEMKKGIKAKLMAATSLLLVSAILLSLTTYAWFILSTAPEVTEMQTTAGANGSLEIALQSTNEATGERAEVQHRTGDSLVVTGNAAKKSNITWGNLIDLSGNEYGLEGISLLPARLNISSIGENNGVSLSNPLSMPMFGQDGRIDSLKESSILQYGETGYQTGGGYGVRIFTDPDQLNNGTPYERTIDRAWLNDMLCERIQNQRETLRATLDETITDNQEDIVTIIYNSMMPGGSHVMEEASALDRLLGKFDTIVGQCMVSVRDALMACAIADMEIYPNDLDGEKALSDLYAQYRWIDMKSNSDTGDKPTVVSVAKANQEALLKKNNVAEKENLSGNALDLYNAYGSVADAAESVQRIQSSVSSAQSKVDSILKESNADSSAIGNAVNTIFNGMTIWIANEDDSVGHLAANEVFGTADVTQLFVANKQLYFYLYRGTGLFSDMSVLLGNFQAYAEKQYKKYVGRPNERTDTYKVNFYATNDESKMDFDLNRNQGCLQTVYDVASPLKVDGTVTYVVQSFRRSSGYGYAVDLAFKSSASGELLLQKEAASRIDSAQGAEIANVQGEGSRVSFIVAEDLMELKPEQIPNLLSTLRIVFMDTDSGRVWSIAKAKENTTKREWIWDADKKKNIPTVSAELALYSPIYRTQNDGLQILDTGKECEAIVTLQPNTEAYITALVYMDGDSVQSASFSADSTQSLSGSINLQFATDAKDLKPMEYTDFIIPENKKSEDGEEGSGQ